MDVQITNHDDQHPHTIEVVDAARLQDPEAFAALFRRFGERLRLWIDVNLGAHLRKRVSPEDVMQETFLAAHRGLDGFQHRGRGSFYGWLLTVARNRIRDVAKREGAGKRDHAREVSGDGAKDDTPPLIMRLAASVSTPSGRAGRHELQERLGAAIQRLPDVERQVLVLRAIEDRTLKEVADAVGKSIGWVHGRYAEALRLMKLELGRELER